MNFIKSLKSILILVLLLNVFSNSPAKIFTKEERGVRGAAILKLGAGAGPCGMGEAYVGVAEDGNSLWYNPAGIVQNLRPQFLMMHTVWLDDTDYDFLGYVHPLGKERMKRCFGGGVSCLSMESLDVIKAGSKVDQVHPYEGVFFLTYSQMLNMLMLGGTIKAVQVKVNEKTSRGFAGDLGLFYKTLDERFSWGLSLQNISPQMEISGSGDPLPLNIGLGGAYRIIFKEDLKKLSNQLLLSLQLDAPIDNSLTGHCGIEYLYRVQENLNFSCRAGYKTNTISDLGLLSGLSSGLGVSWKNFSLDYAFVPYGKLGSTHRMSLGYSLGNIAVSDKEILNHYRRGKIYFRQGQWVNAREEFCRILDLEPQNYRAERFLVKVETKIRQTLDPEILFAQAYNYYQEKNYPEAVNLFKKILDLNPEHKGANLYLPVAREEIEKGEEIKNKKELDRKINNRAREKGQAISACYQNGVKFLRGNDPENALREFSRLLTIDPNHKLAKSYLAKIRNIIVQDLIGEAEKNRERKEWSKVIEQWQKILQYDQGNTTARIKLEEAGKMLLEQNKTEAKRLYDEGLKEYMSDNFPEALRLWDKAGALDPANKSIIKALERVKEEIKFKK